MLLTLDILLYKISQQFNLKIIGTLHTNRILNRVSMWDNSGKSSNALYLYIPGVSPSEGLKTLNSDEYLTLLSSPDYQNVSLPGCYVLCEKEEIWNAVNGILQIVSEFHQWIDMINSIRPVSGNFTELLNAIGAYTQADLSLVNRELVKIAVYNAYPDTEREDLFCEAGELDISTIQQINQNYPDVETDYSKKGILRHPACSEQDPQCLYLFNIHFQNVMHLRLLINIKYQQNHSAIHRLLTWAGEQIETKYVEFYQGHLHDHYREPLYESIRTLMLGNPYDQAQLNEHLRMIGWSPNHSYKVLHLKPVDPRTVIEQLNYYAAQFEQSFINCRAIPLNSDLYALVNLSLFPAKETSIDKYSVFLRESLLFSGASVSYNDIETTFVHRKQADRALYYGMQHDPSIWHHEFEDLALKYILEKCTEEYDATEISHPAVNILHQYDIKHPGSELTKTLQYYLQFQFNATRTAAVLNVHRTTFLYRIGRIEELTGIHLDDPDTILHLMISFAL